MKGHNFNKGKIMCVASYLLTPAQLGKWAILLQQKLASIYTPQTDTNIWNTARRKAPFKSLNFWSSNCIKIWWISLVLCRFTSMYLLLLPHAKFLTQIFTSLSSYQGPSKASKQLCPGKFLCQFINKYTNYHLWKNEANQTLDCEDIPHQCWGGSTIFD